ncbi:MAG: hypothetical protein DMG65_05745 [Candidatus Angelobacter sp. Gp1-AA117]|nr:MAG: hypothetical protein DMG65_05745 [Candidatus Angelobacter sp. Gp1-AA117]
MFFLIITVMSLLLFGVAHAWSFQKNIAAEKLLTESNGFATQLGPGQRASYLVSLTEVAARIRHEQTREWCLEQYRLAPQINDSEWNVASVQKNAIAQLSYVDSRTALDLLSGLKQPPYPNSQGKPKMPPPESLAADAAVTTFANYWRSEKDKRLALAGIESVAKTIPDRNGGQYPFKAMAFLVKELLARSEIQEAAGILKDALRYYKAERENKDKDPQKTFGNTNREFFKLLESSQYGVDSAEYHNSLDVFINSLLEDISKPNPNQQIIVYTANGSFDLGSESEELLLRTLDLVAVLEPEWYKKLQSDHPEVFQNVGKKFEHVERGMNEGGPASPNQKAAIRYQMEENAAFAKINFLKQTNPWGALDIAQKLTDPGKRFAGYASVISSMADLDPARAIKLYSQQLSELKEVDDKAKLTAMVQMAKAAFYVKDSRTFSDLVLTVLDSGVKAVQKSATGDIDERHGYSQLAELVEFSSEHGEAWVEDSIRALPDPALKAYLLIAAAKGVIKSRVRVNTEYVENESKYSQPQSNPVKTPAKAQAKAKLPK